MQLLSALIVILMFLPVLAVLSSMPFLTRETISFGVSVSAEQYHSELLRRMRKQYAAISSAIYAVLLLSCSISLLSLDGKGQNVVMGLFIGAAVATSAIMNLIYYFRMKKLRPSLSVVPAQKSILTVDTGFRRQKLIWSNKWFLIHLAIIVISAIFVLANYNRIPDQVPMRFDYDGKVLSSAAKSYRTVLFPNIMQVIMTGIFFLVNWSIQKSKQQLHAGNPEQSALQNAAFRRRWSAFTVLSGLAMVLMFSFIQLNMLDAQNTQIVMLLSILMPLFIVLSAIILSFVTGQGGSRIKLPEQTDADSHAAPPNDDRYWKLGAIYYNPQDPSIFVEKRMGIGWTLNFARPAGWIILIGILAVILLASFLPFI